jgi:hypothetical protein
MNSPSLSYNFSSSLFTLSFNSSMSLLHYSCDYPPVDCCSSYFMRLSFSSSKSFVVSDIIDSYDVLESESQLVSILEEAKECV